MVNTISGADRYDYDANGNVTVRNKGLSTQQSLTWSDENRLVSVTGSGANLPEWSLYDPDGQRVKKINNSTIATFYPFPHYEVENGTVVKYYFFNGQRVAMRKGGTLYYLHGDHLGSTHFVTKSNGTEQSNQSYYAYGRTRLFYGSTPSDHKFTGQKLDVATGLYYYNARYYDPVVGSFLSPDTLVPDPTLVWDYNRFAYVRGNPLKYTDPSGHCAASESDPDASDCRRWANTIYASWDHTDYWNRMWPDGKDFFLENVATQPIQAEYFKNEFTKYQQSDEFQAWHANLPKSTSPTPVDTGDYWAATLGLVIIEVSVIRDDFGTWYLRGGIGPNFPGPSLSRGDVLINTDPEHRPWRGLKDVDSLNIDEAEKAKLMQEAITGHSTTASATYGLGIGMSSGLNPPYHGSIESVLGFPGASVTNWSYTGMIWSK
jgi:RHS repeat-associated protein